MRITMSRSSPSRLSSLNDSTQIVGLAQGQFSVDDIFANFKKHKITPKLLRQNHIYPMGRSGMQVVFLNSTTMVFGESEALKNALDARDGLAPQLTKQQHHAGRDAFRG